MSEKQVDSKSLDNKNKLVGKHQDSKDQMSAKNAHQKRKNLLIWIFIGILLSVGIVLNSVYANQVALPVRIAGFIVLVVLLMAMSLLTVKGKQAWGFVHAARLEMRRVVWPNRQETVQTTILIIGVVLMAALIMWLFDSLFLYAIRMVISV